ncbi:hypothetical protein RR48_01775 [Papilio machaon]|uniref:Uncharacterized protein n=1 Tax=Papilio machaon TaxID=76193 RepID=A0A0N1PG66_PAPMA|nr:hypothetical protein RR48_01775 [Papilio machaon]
MLRAQRLLDLLLEAARRRLHRAPQPVQHPLERELLHRERGDVAGPLSECRPRLHHTRPRRTAARFWRSGRETDPRRASAQAGASAATRAPPRDRRLPRHRLRNVRQCGLARDRYLPLPRCDTRALRSSHVRRTSHADHTHRHRGGRSPTSPVADSLPERAKRSIDMLQRGTERDERTSHTKAYRRASHTKIPADARFRLSAIGGA